MITDYSIHIFYCCRVLFYMFGFFLEGVFLVFFCHMRLIKSVLWFLGQLYFEEIWVSSTEGKPVIYILSWGINKEAFLKKTVKLWDTLKASYALILTLVNFFVKRLLSDTSLIWCLYFNVHVGIVILCTLVYIVHLL